ncbi:MAG TPA: hypothetical protein VL202_03900 [Pararhizobium sp.]|uniref:hypothetical protein n=1 Tax=Pararhizobium sp. TaxID=1977563 RepID=UPI002CDA748C|nr:hypothetical protein [Pararhizobium sp.]HTO30312.1 hypothetical protein [Pararhizobium sp.]
MFKFLKNLFSHDSQKTTRPNPSPYNVYTRDFDSTISASALQDVLGRLSPEDSSVLEQSWHIFETSLMAWRMECGLKAIEASQEIGEFVRRINWLIQ